MMDIKDRLDLAIGIADRLKASSTLSATTIYDLCLHISKAHELVEKSNVIHDVSNMLQWCYNYVNKQKDSDEKKRLIEELKKMGCL